MKKNITTSLIIILLIIIGFLVYSSKKSYAPISSEQKQVEEGLKNNTAENIKEWNLHYSKTQNTQNIIYSFKTISDFPGKNAGLTSEISFTYNPKTEVDTNFNATWGSCPLPTIAQYTTDPIGQVAGVGNNDVRKIADKYYLLDAGIQEPCTSNGVAISGNAAKMYQSHREAVIEIFKTLAVN